MKNDEQTAIEFPVGRHGFNNKILSTSRGRAMLIYRKEAMMASVPQARTEGFGKSGLSHSWNSLATVFFDKRKRLRNFML